MSDYISMTTKDVSKGKFASIGKVEGELASLTRVKSTFKNADGSPANDQIELKARNAIILGMLDGEPEPDLRDDVFTCWFSYAPSGKDKAGPNTFWIKGLVASAEKLGKTPADLIGSRVVLEKREVYLFTSEDKTTGEKEDHSGTNYIFVDPNEEANTADVGAKVKELVAGKTPTAAMRELMLSTITNRNEELKAAARDGTLGTLVPGISIVDGLYVVESADAD